MSTKASHARYAARYISHGRARTVSRASMELCTKPRFWGVGASSMAMVDLTK